MSSYTLLSTVATLAGTIFVSAWASVPVREFQQISPMQLAQVRGWDQSAPKDKDYNCTQANLDWLNYGLPVGDPLYVFPFNGCEPGLDGYDCIQCGNFNDITVKGQVIQGGWLPNGTRSCNGGPFQSLAGTCFTNSVGKAVCAWPSSYSCSIELQRHIKQQTPIDP